MGIRDIQKKMKLKEAMAKKAAEIKAEEIQSKARVQDFTASKIREIAGKHGFILAINDEIMDEIEQLKQKHGIPESRVIRKIVNKEEIVNSKGKIDHDKLGWFIFQEVLIKKEETGGIFTVPELFVFLKPFEMPSEVTIKDVERAMAKMSKSRAIAGMETLSSGVSVVYFFDEKFSSDHRIVLDLARKQGSVTMEELLEMEWTQKRAETVLETLTRSGIARFDESYLKGKKWYFPGIT